MEKTTDHDWVERARRGEPAAVGELYHRYWRAARAAAYGVTGDFALAEDAASEAFCAALENLPDLRDPARFGPWLRTIVVRVARRLKRAKPTPPEIRRGESTFALAPSTQAERSEMALMIHEAVGNLSETLRETIGLFYFEGYSVAEAARFLDIPPGTVKRRLHEGRQRLRTAIEQIRQGDKPMDTQREQVLQRLKDLLDSDGDACELHEAMRQALSLRPPPVELLDAVRKRLFSKAASELKQDKRREQAFRTLMHRYHGPSEKAQDPNHPIGAVAQAIRAALPEFQEYRLDTAQVVQSMLGEGKSVQLPPELAQGLPGSFFNVSRGMLMLRPDGSMLPMREFLAMKTSAQADEEKASMRPCLSDVVDLFVNRADGIELRVVEELLTHLAATIASGVSSWVVSCEYPHYRSALLLQFADIRLPAALGGVLYRRPEMPTGVGSARVRLYLESWAAARTGQVFTPQDMSSVLEEFCHDTPPQTATDRL